MFQEVTQMICAGTVSKNSLTNENLAFAFPRALTNWQCNMQILFLTFDIQVTCNSFSEASVTQSTGFSVSYMKHPTTWNYCHFIFYHWYFYNFILLLYRYMWHRFDLGFFFLTSKVWNKWGTTWFFFFSTSKVWNKWGTTLFKASEFFLSGCWNKF